ncbi:CHAP domain-containing protein [Ideonella paludis]
MLGKGGKRPERPYPHGKDYVDLAENTSDPTIKVYREKAQARGYNPDKLGPLPVCDCSGFIWWVLGEARNERNTDWIHQDARNADIRFRVVSTSPDFPGRPGDLLVYAHHGKTSYGHVGLITEVQGGTAEGPASQVIHCSSGNMELPPRDGQIYPSGIAETGVEVFKVHHNPQHPEWSTLVCRPWLLWD